MSEALGSDKFTHTRTSLHVYASLSLQTLGVHPESVVEKSILMAPGNGDRTGAKRPWYELLLPLTCEQPLSLHPELGMLSHAFLSEGLTSLDPRLGDGYLAPPCWASEA